MMPILLRLFAFSVVAAAVGCAMTQVPTARNLTAASLRTSNDDCGEMTFRYLITYDEQHSSVVRHVEVFLDERAFKEENLRILFAKLSKKYSDAVFLVVVVNTSWDQLPFPLSSDACPGIATSGSSKVEEYNHYIARFYRRDGKEFFTYTPTLRTGKFKDVIVKGNMIYRNGVWREPNFWKDEQ